MTEVPGWLLQEIGRLHVHALALERTLAERQADTDEDGEGE